MKVQNFIGQLVNLHKHLAKERWAHRHKSRLPNVLSRGTPNYL